MKLNLGCSSAHHEGYLNVDRVPPADLVADLSATWPWKDNSIDGILGVDIIEHLPAKIFTMNEIWRVLKPGAIAELEVPTTVRSRSTRNPESERRRSVQSVYHVLNLGAGIQSTFLYLAWETLGLPSLDAAIFADTQEEPEDVYAHLEWLKSLNRAPILTGTAGKLGEHLKDGRASWGQPKLLDNHHHRFAAIPAFTTDGTVKGRTKRQCSKEYKIEVIGKVVRRQLLGLEPGRTAPRGVHVNQYIGISLDEAGRAARLQRVPCPKYLSRHFPLVERFITRAHAVTWLAPRVPHTVPRSACVFCPFHSDAEWLRIKSNPQDWARAVEIDEALRTPGSVAMRAMKQSLYVHRSCQPLIQIDFKPAANAHEAQSNFNFAPECLGVCGV